ncbi:Fimbrial protein [compost metagenome]|jgi:type 1 fimbria pilin|uniref:fimbrial protein n=1 Tax=Achromobacter sp. TaxID=134375 RepID=UPI000FBD2AC8
MGKRRLRHPVGQVAWAALATVAVMVVLGALPHSASGAQQGAVVAAECRNYSDGLSSGWEPVEPLTAQSQVGQVLYEKRTAAMIAFRPVRLPGATGKYQLATTAMWTNASNMVGHAAKTNVAGIGLRLMLRELETPVYVPLVMDVIDIAAGGGQSVRVVNFEYVQQLVLLVPPENLPRRMKVTGVAPGVGLVLTFFTAEEGYASPGALSDMPSWQGYPPTVPPAKICALTEKYIGDQVFNMGGNAGDSIDIFHACEAGAHQNVRVDMLPAFIADFPAEGSVSAPKPFQISLNQCSAFARPQVKFRAKSGLVAGTDSVLALYDTTAHGEKAAQGFGIIVVDSEDRRIRFGPVGGAYGPEYVMTTQGGGAQLSLAARYIRTAGNRQDVESGVANAAAEFTFEFP